MLNSIRQKTASNFLERGKEILQDRGNIYDKDDKQEERSMEKAVKVFELITGKPLTEVEGWQFMACLKQVRAFQRKDFHEDSWQDGINYLALGAEAAAAAQGFSLSGNKPVTKDITLSILDAVAFDRHCMEQRAKGFKPVPTWHHLDSYDQERYRDAVRLNPGAK